MSRPERRWSLALGIAFLVVVSGLALPLGATRAHAGASGIADLRDSGGLSASGVPPARPPTVSLCPAPPPAWDLLYGGLASPPALDPSKTGLCDPGVDENALSLLSNASGSGARTSLSIALPAAGSAVASALASLSVRLWVSGVPCAVDQAAQVVVQLIPPMSPYVAFPQSNWSVRAPAYGLVAPATCDPTCSNDTALVSFAGAPMCEDQLVLPSTGAPPLDPVGAFAPGDTLSVTFVGDPAGSEGLAVYVNDSLHPSGDLTFQYSASSVVTGRPLEPLFSSSNLSGSVWGLAPALSVVATHCPLVAAPSEACTSYDDALWSGLRPVELLGAHSWNTSDGAYDLPYDGVATISSSGNCTVRPYACTATPLSTQGTFDPFWALHGRDGASFWTYGAHYPTEVRAFPTDAGPSNGTVATFAAPIALGPLDAAVSVSTFNVSVRITDPAGVANVSIAADYCFNSSTVVPTVVEAVLGSGPTNTTVDGNWTAQFAVGGFAGTFPTWVQVYSPSSGLVAAGSGSVTLPTGVPACTLLSPALPTPKIPFATPVAAGYLVQWSEADPAVVGFTVLATAPNGSSRFFDVGRFNETRIDLGVSNVSFNVSVSAYYGGNVTSAFTVPAPAAPTLDPFSLSVAVSSALPLWLGGLPLNVSGTVAGGAGPYQVDLSFGDGGTASVATNGTFASVHGYGLFFGEAWVQVHASDAVGDSASSAPFLVPVWATPIGSASSAIGGDSLVEIQWQVPASPSGTVLGARVFYTTVVTLASALTWAGSSNSTVPGIQVWNLTGNLLFVPVANGQTLYAQVVARNSFGLGQLPNGAPTALVAQPAPLVLSPITSVGGGGAPFSDNFSAQLTGGSNDSVSSAFYAFPSGGTSSATLTYVNGTSYLNASHTFPSPGTFVVVLHATDALFETLIDTTTVFVAPGASPGLSALVVNGPAYAGGSVDFEASATGGSGNYSFNWSFGDGTTSNGTNAVHTYDVSGAYSVLVNVVDEITGGASAIVVPVVVFSLPVIFISVTSGPNGSLSYDLRASVGGGSGPSSVVWSFGDGTIGRGSLVSHDYRESGTYSVNVTATDPAGRSGTASFNLTASAAPAPTGPGGGSSGFTLLDLVLVAVAAFLLATTLYFGSRARPPAEPDAAEEREEAEDGEVSLT